MTKNKYVIEQSSKYNFDKTVDLLIEAERRE
jgi:hypothetical protein